MQFTRVASFGRRIDRQRNRERERDRNRNGDRDRKRKRAHESRLRAFVTARFWLLSSQMVALSSNLSERAINTRSVLSRDRCTFP